MCEAAVEVMCYGKAAGVIFLVCRSLGLVLWRCKVVLHGCVEVVRVYCVVCSVLHGWTPIALFCALVPVVGVS